MTRVLVLYYSLYGHVHALAGEAAAGVAENGCQALVRRVPETLTPEVLQALGAAAFQKEFSQVATVTLKDLEEADGILFGTPTRFGNMCGQMRQFLDSTGQLWAKGALVGKPGA
ncbi:MAG TPA: NAD(P)H-dependent oxidoreductase, partial [Candidatus Aminicenantes bacterium]|nr:NAD(P)H-dependent oxidoreductase [Candidatus Aminicenantes bacterium]